MYPSLNQVSALGSVKRKSDQTELSRREVILVDQTGKSVAVTLWGDVAVHMGAELETLSHPVVTISSVKVGDYNGLSLSTITRSEIKVNPETAEARKLRTWYDGEGKDAAFVAANEGLPGQRAAGERGVRPLAFLADLSRAEIYADSKPEYHNLYARFTRIPDQQTFYYLACKEAQNRKVVAQGDGTFKCEHDGNVYDQTQVARRYIMSATVSDVTGSMSVNVFDDQAKDLLGMSADDFAAHKEGETDEARAGVKRALDAACFTELWSVRVQVRPNEYNNEVRKRVNVASMQKVDFARESEVLVRRIKGMMTAAA
jgi:replication factor A1